VTDLVTQYGPLKKIWRTEESKLLEEGKWQQVLTLQEFEGKFHLSVGHHLVNVQEIYETAKPMPEGLEIGDRRVWFGDDGLPG
jgi:hypothetical protein